MTLIFITVVIDRTIVEDTFPNKVVPSEDSHDTPQNETKTNDQNAPVNEEFVYDSDIFPCDPGKRIPISSYPPNDQDMIRREFISKGRFQPRNHSFPQTEFGTQHNPCKRQFKEAWYDKYNWLEYSIEKDAAFCFVCYLFKDKTSIPGNDKFVRDEFKSWNRAHERFQKHIGQTVVNAHKQAQEKYDFFNSPKASIVENFNKTTNEVSILYKARLTHSLDCLKFLLRQGLAFRGHNESKTSSNKDLIHACAKETNKLILDELAGDDYFAILADESSDVSYKEQLAICLRFVNKRGRVCESFLGVVKMKNTCSLSLKVAIKKMIEDNKLS